MRSHSIINPASFGAATATALILVLGQPALAQSKVNERANERAIVPPLPPMRTRPGVIVGPMPGPIVGPITSPIVGPIGSSNRNATSPPPRTPNHPFEHENDRERGAFAAGVAAGAAIGGAVVIPAPGVYYAPMPSPIYDPVGYCTWMYSSYDPQSGTYIGDDGNPHPCPP